MSSDDLVASAHQNELDFSHLPIPTTDPSYLDFLNRANAYVEECRAPTDQALLSGSRLVGKWHPNGFATFDIKQFDEGLVRLHVWPAGLRRSLPGHPDIHCHSFRLFSRVFAGNYRESLYEIREESPTRLHRYEVLTSREKGSDSLMDTLEDVGIVCTHSGLDFAAGSWHEIEVGAFHATPIPLRGFCATLAFLSRRVLDAPDTLLGRPGFSVMSNVRPVVSDLEFEEIRQQLLDRIQLPGVT